jgi:hypothetical protein
VLLGVLMCLEYEVRGPSCRTISTIGHQKFKGLRFYYSSAGLELAATPVQRRCDALSKPPPRNPLVTAAA